ncbi:MAG: glycoside hydrolase family 3 protein [Clostridium sp.]|nr:glycoside hydrolase family 3 protein [Clostridium sp.]
MSNFRKKLLSIVTAFIVVATFAGCSNSSQNASASLTNTSAVQETASSASKSEAISASNTEAKAESKAKSSAASKTKTSKGKARSKTDKTKTSKASKKASTSKTTAEKATASKTKSTSKKDKVSKLLSDMTLEEKVGQLFIVAPEALDESLNSSDINSIDDHGYKSINSAIKKTMKKYPPGGIIMFSKNIDTPKQITAFTNDLQKSSEIPLFISVDEEGGQIARIANNSNFKVKKYSNMLSIGKAGDTSKAKEAGKTISSYLTKYGFNLDFAPVADVFSNPKNTVIGNRAFSSDCNVVADMVSAEIKGFHSNNVMCCIKHFPGHGDTTGDTHKDYVSVNKSWNELKKCEIIPFKSGIDAGCDMIMVAHITANKATKDSLPCTLSYDMITTKLRGELGYDGVVITDSLSMGAITKNYTSANAAVKAFSAGADILLMPNDYQKAFDGIIKAIDNKTISKKRLDESVKRILKLKDKYGLI